MALLVIARSAVRDQAISLFRGLKNRDCLVALLAMTKEVMSNPNANEQPRSKLRGIEHPSLNSFRGKPRGIEPGGIQRASPNVFHES